MASARSTVLRILGAVAATGLLSLAFGGVRETVGAQQPPDSRQAMVKALSASGPHPSLGDEARVFDRLVGTWNCDYTFLAGDGSVRRSSGELKFGWIIDGRAVQDIWITYPEEPAKERGIGTSVRFFDNKSKMWRVVFVSPAHGALITVQGRAEADRIVLRGVDDEGSMLRWSFNDIQTDSFIWRGEKSRDGGKTWRLEEEHHMRRRSSGDSTEKPSPEASARDPRTDRISAPQASGPHSAAAFQQLAALVGEWKGVQGGTEIKVTYTLTANGSALMEEFRPVNNPVMITMFTVDGDHLLATHYCSAGNQPQMTTQAITQPSWKSLAFSLVRVTGMATPEDWHNTGLAVTLEDKQHLTQEWSYEYKGKRGTTVFHFTRTQ